MRLTLVDWLVIGGYILVNMGIGLWYRRRAVASTDEFFAGGRNVSLVLQFGFGWSTSDPRQFSWTVLVTVACSTVAWVAATLVTPAEPRTTLVAFYRKVRPAAAGWGPIAREAADITPTQDARQNLLAWAAGCLMVYLTLFGVGRLIFGDILLALGDLAVATLAGGVVYANLRRRGWKVIDV